MRVTSLIYAAAGSPDMPAERAGLCRCCGCQDRGGSFAGWVKSTFTDHDKLQPGSIVCRACLFCFEERSAELTQRSGKGKPQRMRNYSHFVVDSEWIPLSKGEKPHMRELLPNAEVAVIAISGQKHLAFRCPPGWWQIEEHTVRPFQQELEQTIRVCAELYEGGFFKSEIESGRYSSKRIAEFGLARWREGESEIKPLRGTLRLQLALFLITKEEASE